MVEEIRSAEFYTIEQCYVRGSPAGLRLFGRYEDKEKFDILVKGIDPYFYISEEEESSINFKCKREKGFKSIFGEKLIKLTIDNPWNLVNTRYGESFIKRFNQTFEGDIPYPTRYLIDKKIYTSIKIEDGKLVPGDVIVEPRICLLDIETDYYGGENEDMNCPINALSFYDNYTKQFYVIAYHPNYKNEERNYSFKSEVVKDIVTKEFVTFKVKMNIVKNEYELLFMFRDYVLNMDFDIFTAWNSNFDMSYIITRMDRIGLDASMLSPVKKTIVKQVFNRDGGSFSKKHNVPMIRGRAILDFLKGYKRLKWNQLDSFRLENVGQKEFGIGKINYDGWMGEFWKKDFEKFIKYNIRDVEICIALDNQYSVIEFLLNLRRLTGCELSDVHYNSRMFDVYNLRYANGLFILPSRIFRGDYTKGKESGYKGGEVLEPVVGLYKNVAVVDLKSLYPHIMLAFNMSPETLVENGKIEVGNGITFSDKPGILKEVLTNLINKRDELRDLLKTPVVKKDPARYKNIYRRQYAVKTFTNSAYGIQGFPNFRLYKPEIAASITYVGRYLTLKMKDLAESVGCVVVRGDTDAVMVSFGEELSAEEVVKKGKELEDKINYCLQNEWFKTHNCDTSYFSIKFEKLYETMFNGKEKKLYAGKIIWDWEGGFLETPEVEIKGFASKRSDRSSFARNLQRTIFNMIFDKKTKDDVIAFIKEEINTFKKQNIEDLAIPKAIIRDLDSYKNKDPWVLGVKYSLKHIKGFTFSPKPLLLYTIPSSLVDTKSFCFNRSSEIPFGIVIDWERMMTVNIYNIIKSQMTMLNIDEDIIINAIKNKTHNQSTLEEFVK